MNKFSSRSYKNLKDIHPDLVTVMVVAIQDSPYDFTITQGLRSTQEQKELFARGRTKSGQIITYADGEKNKSNHQAKADGYGYAVDLYPYYSGSVQTGEKGEGPEVRKRLKAIAEHIKKVAKELKISVEWGGDWKMCDDPHFELKKP